MKCTLYGWEPDSNVLVKAKVELNHDGQIVSKIDATGIDWFETTEAARLYALKKLREQEEEQQTALEWTQTCIDCLQNVDKETIKEVKV